MQKRRESEMMPSRQESQIHIGTSGWHYTHWKGSFYPRDISANEMLGYYASRFSTVEINNSFYQLPGPETVRRWRESVPDDFIFAFKASRYITHMKKLKDPHKSLQTMLDVARRLGPKLGPILFQLPPRWRADPVRLRGFTQALPEDYRYTFEFRDASWFDDDITAILHARGAAFCIYQIEGHDSPKNVTSDFIYIRLHGPSVRAYQGKYDIQTLSDWADELTRWQQLGKTVFCYFDNDQNGYAAQNAMQLQGLVAGGA